MTTSPEERPIVTIEGLTKAYGYLPVLRSLDLEVQRGECVALLGANGSGKSTLLRLISGLIKPSGGRILVGGWEMPHQAAAVRGHIGMVSHKALLYSNLTARENLAFFARLYNVPASERDAHIEALLARVGLSKRADSLVRTFSRGMQQRLSIARALLPKPDVLLFDEPYTGLDQDASLVLDEILRQTHAEGHTMLMATHLLERAARIASRVIILNRGQIALDVPTSQLGEEDIALRYAAATGGAVPS